MLPLFLLDLALKRAVPGSFDQADPRRARDRDRRPARGRARGQRGRGAERRRCAEGLAAASCDPGRGDPGVLGAGGGRRAGAACSRSRYRRRSRGRRRRQRGAGGRSRCSKRRSPGSRRGPGAARPRDRAGQQGRRSGSGRRRSTATPGGSRAKLGVRTPVMMFARPTFRVALVTVHVPLARVPALVTAERLAEGRSASSGPTSRACSGIPDARIHVLGLNPHAGEEGGIGREEADVIAPAVEALRAEGIPDRGPVPARIRTSGPASSRAATSIVAMVPRPGAAAGEVPRVRRGGQRHARAADRAHVGRSRDRLRPRLEG